jgi:hypothetical protein
MDTTNGNFPWVSRAQLQREHEQACRQLDRERYIAKFEDLFGDIDMAIIGLEVLAEYDSAAREAANALKDALADARSIIEASA